MKHTVTLNEDTNMAIIGFLFLLFIGGFCLIMGCYAAYTSAADHGKIEPACLTLIVLGLCLSFILYECAVEFYRIGDL